MIGLLPLLIIRGRHKVSEYNPEYWDDDDLFYHWYDFDLDDIPVDVIEVIDRWPDDERNR